MSGPRYTINADGMTFRPLWNTGWHTILDHRRQEILMQRKLLGLRVPGTRRIPYDSVVKLYTVARPVWWHQGGARVIRRSLLPYRIFGRGWVFEIFFTPQGGRETRMATLKPTDPVFPIEAELASRFGLEGEADHFVTTPQDAIEGRRTVGQERGASRWYRKGGAG